ncbi:MAG TPA: Uma2 family endonuclease [Pyrinomonadaceae bacterium]|nr:Uma2 family endonuclease [Pyrinomonadaceae bacterium]
MTTVLNFRDVAAEERFVLRNVTWETYEQLLKNYENCSVPRLTYDQGDLEIMSPSPPHEATSRLLSLLVNIICEERELDVLDVGSTTHKRADLLKGIEPDGCFYIQNVELIRDVDDLDLTVHPPVDLAIEVDLTSPSVAKLPIYAVLGVPEVWQFEEGKVKFLRLKLGGYAAIGESVVLPGISAEAVTRFLNEASTMKRPEWLRAVREWIRSLERR